MKKTFKVDFSVDEKQVSDLISIAMSDKCGFGWWDYDEKAYEEAKSELLSERKPDADDQICLEDVLARMLFKGKKLRLLDPESDWHWSGHEPDEMLWRWQIIAEQCEPEGGEWHEVGLEDIVRGAQMYGQLHYANRCGADIGNICEYGDFTDADIVFQLAAYGEVIYG